MFTFWHRSLQTLFAIFVLMGLALALFGTSDLFAPLNDPLNQAFFGAGPPAAEVMHYQAFAFGVMGALTAAWALLGFFVARFGLEQRLKWAWVALVDSVLVWYVVDSGLSVWLGAGLNAAANTGYLALLAIPLLAIRKDIWRAPRAPATARGATA